MYSKKYIEHFSSPRNVGTIENPDASCSVVNTEGGCFDTVDVFVKADGRTITDFKYKLKACSGTITVFSLLSETLTGKSADELDGIDFKMLDEMLGGLPEKKHHSIRLALEAKDKIVEQLKNKEKK
jgi:nitrogen fixation protein NifU and related proteins